MARIFQTVAHLKLKRNIKKYHPPEFFFLSEIFFLSRLEFAIIYALSPRWFAGKRVREGESVLFVDISRRFFISNRIKALARIMI
jgi:hypothetical protein